MAIVENDYAAYLKTSDGEIPLRDLDAQEKIEKNKTDISELSEDMSITKIKPVSRNVVNDTANTGTIEDKEITPLNFWLKIVNQDHYSMVGNVLTENFDTIKGKRIGIMIANPSSNDISLLIRTSNGTVSWGGYGNIKIFADNAIRLPQNSTKMFIINTNDFVDEYNSLGDDSPYKNFTVFIGRDGSQGTKTLEVYYYFCDYDAFDNYQFTTPYPLKEITEVKTSEYSMFSMSSGGIIPDVSVYMSDRPSYEKPSSGSYGFEKSDKGYRFYLNDLNHIESAESKWFQAFAFLLGKKKDIQNVKIYFECESLNEELSLQGLTTVVLHNTTANWNGVSVKNNLPYINVSDVNLEQYSDDNNIYFIFGVQTGNYSVPTWNQTTFDFDITFLVQQNNGVVIADLLRGYKSNDFYTKQEVDSLVNQSKYITCWGDSLTAGGGWTTRLQELSGMTVYNGGTGGEDSKTILSRQGGDVMTINNITIPASNEEAVLIASRKTDNGILTEEGNKVTPLLQGGAHVNPVKIGDIEGTLKWTGSSYSDENGTWTFTRTESGEPVTIDRPTAIRTDFDRNKNAPHLMVIFMGQNGGYADLDDLVRQHRLMIEHAQAKHVIVLGLSSGTAAQRKDYEDRMKKEFGRYFISLRQYLSHPIYDVDGETIISCYGMADQDVEIDPDYTYEGKTTIQEISKGIVPHQILADGVHYTSGTKTVIGEYIYKKCCELNIF